MENMSTSDHVFRSLDNILLIIKNTKDLNKEREQLVRSLENVISWENDSVAWHGESYPSLAEHHSFSEGKGDNFAECITDHHSFSGE